MKTPLIHEIEEFLTETGLGHHRFGIKAAGNGRLVERLRKNRRVWPETEDKVRAFIRSERKRLAAARK